MSVTMKTAGESPVRGDNQGTRESELLAKVALFRKELSSVVPPALNNARYRSLVNCLGFAAHNIEICLYHSGKLGVPLSDFESRQKLILLESAKRHFDELRRLRAEMISLMDSYRAQPMFPMAGTTKKRSARAMEETSANR
jgi:hypothetical protein